MKTEKIKLGEKEYEIRKYESPGVCFTHPIDRLILHLAYHSIDDYCNPPGAAWAALIAQPFERLQALRLASPQRLTDQETSFLRAVSSLIVSVGESGMVNVSYFASDIEACAQWKRLKYSAQFSRCSP